MITKSYRISCKTADKSLYLLSPEQLTRDDACLIRCLAHGRARRMVGTFSHKRMHARVKLYRDLRVHAPLKKKKTVIISNFYHTCTPMTQTYAPIRQMHPLSICSNFVTACMRIPISS